MTIIENLLNKTVETDYKLSISDAELLFNTIKNEDLQILKSAADRLREKLVGNDVSYIVNLNTNFTNICESICLFCGFRRSDNESEAYVLDLDDFEEKLYNSEKIGGTEVCLQGGLYSKLKIKGLKSVNKLDMYAELLQWVKERHPKIHLHAYSPEEIEFLSLVSGKSIKYILEYLKDSGLDSMPGTAAEILVDEVRKKVCPKKLNTAKWVEIITQAHQLKIPTTATIMYGHLESNHDRALHLSVLRDLQMNTGGLTEFIPLPLIANKTLLSSKVTPLTSIDRLKMLAISRLFFKELIPNIQSSWVKQGMEEAGEALNWGVNDVGGTLGDEKITFAAGGKFGQGTSAEELINLIKSQGKIPVLRDTLYNRLAVSSVK